MRDLQRELRDYFDDVVEQVSAEDVFAQVRVTRRPRWTRNAWVAVTAAVSVIAGVGSIFMAHWLLRAGPRLFRSSHQAASAATATSWLWPVLIGIAAALAIGAITVVVFRSKKGEGVETIERTTETTPLAAKPNKWLVVTLAVLLVVALAAIVWLLVAPQGASLPADGQAMLDDYLAGWNAHDGDAVLAVMGNAKHINGDFEYSGGDLRNLVNNLPDGWTVEDLGTPTVIETPVLNSSAYLVVTRESIGVEPFKTEGVSIFRLSRTFDDTWRIVSHEWMQS